MTPPEGLVYSTAPRSFVSSHGEPFVVKGPDSHVVIAEAIAYGLAGDAGLIVPDFALARIPGDPGTYFASRKEQGVLRSVLDPWLRKQQGAVRLDVASVVVFDVWIANEDRNAGNFLARPRAGSPGQIDVIAIDFEKSWALRGPYPLVQAAQVEPRRLWPTGELGQLLQGVPLPVQAVERIEGLPDDTIEGAVARVANTLPNEFTWFDSVTQALRSRRDSLRQLAEECWP